MKRSRFISILALTAVLAALALRYVPGQRRAAAAGSLPDLLAIVPADARFLAYADIAALRDSPMIQRLTAMAPPATTDRDYADFVSATGFNYQRDLDRVVIANRQSNSADQTIAFAEGRFNKEKIEQYALRSGKLERVNGRAVYLIPSAKPGKTISVTFLSSDRIGLTDGGDFSAAFSTSNIAADPAMRDRISRVAGTPLFAISKAPTSASGPGASGGAAVFSLAFQSLRWMSFAARPDGEAFLLSAEGECDTPAQAQSVAAGLDLLRGLLRNGLGDPKVRGKMPAASAAAVGQLLGSAQLTTDASRVRLLMTVTPEMLTFGAGNMPPSGH